MKKFAISVKLLKDELMLNFYDHDQVKLANKYFNDGQYRPAALFEVYGEEDTAGCDIAEEIFDLTNNPSRDVERWSVYGQQRGVSVGDIVTVNGFNYLCLSAGFVRI